MKAKVYVTLKKSVLDPQGKTIQSALDALGFRDVAETRAGKMFELSFKDGLERSKLERDLKKMCERLLANPVIEDYRWEIE